MNNKGVSWAIIGIVIVAVVVVGVVAYWGLTSTGGENGDNGDNGGNGGNGGEDFVTAENATSLEFKVSATIGGMEEEYAFMAKNLGTSEAMLRVEQVSGGSNFIYIMNQAEQKVWAAFEGEWMDVSEQFSMYWDETWEPALESYQTQLADWAGIGEYEYSVGSDSYKIYDVVLNPTLADSLFTHE